MTTNLPGKSPRRPTIQSETGPTLRWVFRRGSDALTCAVETAVARSSFDVCVLPHWNLAVGTVEHFNVPEGALRRHAEIASRLRQAGWVAEYGAGSPS